MTKPRVLLLAKGFPPTLGGVESYSESLAHAYARAGYRVCAIAPATATPHRERRGGVMLFDVGQAAQPVVFYRILKRLWGLKRRGRFTHIHATTWRMALPALLCFGTRVPLYGTIHTNEVLRPRFPLTLLMKGVFSLMKACLVISRFSLEACRPRLPHLAKKAVISWNGATPPHDLMANPAVTEGPVRILTACRLIDGKGVGELIRAAAPLIHHGKNIEIHVAGDGPLLPALKALCREQHIEKQVIFEGRLDQPALARAYAAAHIFVHAHTKPESFCLTLADGMAFGLPVVAGNVGAPPEYIQHGVTGFIIDGQDTAAFTQVLQDLIDNPTQRAAVGQAARSWAAAHLSWDQHLARFLAHISAF